MAVDETRICYHCGVGPAVIDASKCTPGETHFQPCSACGQVGTQAKHNLYQEFRRKKPKVPMYQNSPYRGGRL